MSGNNYNDFSDVLGNDGGQETGKGLRAVIEQLVEQNKKLTERFEKQERERTVANLFKEKGLDPQVAELMGEADPEEWIAKYGALFQTTGKKLDEELTAEQKLEQQRAADQANQQHQNEEDLQAEREAYEAMTGLDASDGVPSASQDALDKIKSFDNEADLLKFMGIQGKQGI